MNVHVIGTLAVPTGGVNGQVLTKVAGAPAWADPTGGGGGGTIDAEQVRDIIGAALVAGTNITITVNDGADTITLAVSGLTKSTVGLANVDNTSDANKPISTAVATALGDKASTADLALKADASALAAKADASTVAAKADNSTVVHRTGNLNESIDGIKTFTGIPVVPANAWPISRVSGLQTALDAKVDETLEITLAQLMDELSSVPGLITGRRFIDAVDAISGVQAITYASGAWMQTPRASARVRLFFSQNDSGASAPLGMDRWDLWFAYPSA